MERKRNFLQRYILMGMLFSISMLQSQAPTWSVNSANFSLDASIVGVLKISDEISTDTNDIIAVFDENEVIRGVANVSFNTALNKYLVFMSIHSNTNGDALKFKIYDASEDTILESTNAVLNFSPNVVLGNADTPFEIKANKVLSVDYFKTIDIAFYPNPVKDKLFISSKEMIKSIKIYNILGQEVLSSTINSNKVNLQTSKLEKGIYLIKATSLENKNITKKMIKK